MTLFFSSVPWKAVSFIQGVATSKISIPAFIIISATVSTFPLKSDKRQLGDDEVEAPGIYHPWRFIPITALFN